MPYYSRSLRERVQIQLEIYYENLLDFMGRSALRKPLMILAGIAVVFTLRNSRSTISSLKRNYLSPFGSKWSSSNQFSVYGTTASAGGYGRSTNSNSYGSSPYSSPSYGSSSSYSSYNSGASPYASAPGGSPYQQFGQVGSNSGYATSTSNYANGNLRGTQSTSPSLGFSTSSLVDQYSSSVQVAQGGLFHDYGMTSQFMGQIETVMAVESPKHIQQILNSPGESI